MTHEELLGIKQRLLNATPGPWFCDTSYVKAGPDIVVADTSAWEEKEPGPNTEFIANAPTDIEALLTELEFKNAQVAELEEVIAKEREFWEKEDRCLLTRELEIDRLKGLVEFYKDRLGGVSE